MRAISTQVKKRTAKLNGHDATDSDKAYKNVEHETKVKELGSSRRNITRKKGGNEQQYDNKNKKQGGAG